MTETLDIFADIVGQDSTKRKLGFFLQCHRNTGIIPTLLFTASKGSGKTFLANAFRKGLIRREGELAGQKAKLFIEVNCSTIKSIKQFFSSLVIPHINDKEVTILFDEASELPTDVSNALLTILAPNPNNKTTFSFDEYVVDFDFSRQSFIFATSEPHRLHHALKDRMERVDLEAYSANQLEQIVRHNLKDVAFEPSALSEIASVLRGNARSAQKMANHIRSFLGASKTFLYEEWAEMKCQLGINKLGLTPTEIQILQTLQQHPHTSLTRLSAVTGLTKEALMRDAELYLQNLDLMEITNSGRSLTAKGHQYLKSLKTN